MISEQQLFDQGWRRYGDNEDDPYYRLILDGSVFGLYALSGNFKGDSFEIYSMHNRIFNDIKEIDDIININGFKINCGIVKK